MSIYLFSASFVALMGATFLYLWHTRDRRQDVGRYATIAASGGTLLLGSSMLLRASAPREGQFPGIHEVPTVFAFGVVVACVGVERRFGTRTLGPLLGLALGLLAYSSILPSTIEPLVPALQNNLLFTLHSTAAVLAYGSYAVALGAGLLALRQRPARSGWLPSPSILDDLSYRFVAAGALTLALAMVLGSVWARSAWGRFWAWDPVEVTSLVTLLVYFGYLQARRVRGCRRGHRAAILVAGLVAVLFAVFGNLLDGGLHRYVGLQ